jgi:WD40 repeat protein
LFASPPQKSLYIIFSFYVLNRNRGYSRSVKCVEFVPDDPNVFASGSRENAIFIWDIRYAFSLRDRFCETPISA